MQIIIDRLFKRRLQGRFGKYNFEVGILEDKPHFKPLTPFMIGRTNGEDVLGTYAGTTVRKASRKPSGKTVAQVSKEFREHLGFNYLARPFKDETTDVAKFTKEFFKLAFGRSQKKRAENLLQAVVRNPMLKKELGYNTPLTQKIKGFDHKGMDTAQLFKNIKAFCKIKPGLFGGAK